eukprot:gene7312-8509_t
MISDYAGPTPTIRFQQSVLADYSEGDHEFEEELITSYKTSVAEHLPKLHISLAKGDDKESILHSHDIKGSSSYIGAEAVRFVSGKMEAYCKENQLDKAEGCLPELEKEVSRLFKMLDKYMKTWCTDNLESESEAEDDDKAVEDDDEEEEEEEEVDKKPPVAAAVVTAKKDKKRVGVQEASEIDTAKSSSGKTNSFSKEAPTSSHNGKTAAAVEKTAKPLH